MKRPLFLFLTFLISSTFLSAQYQYEPSDAHPFGMPNPDAPAEIKDYHPLIGISDCKSVSRNPDGSWQDTVDMTWEFKYIMNGNAVQDQTFKMDQTFAGSIRQYNPDSSKWYVHYYSSGGAPAQLPAWGGGKQGHQMILYRPQTAPNGMEGFYKIIFKDISEDGFNWLGQWVNPDESIQYPTWTIGCKNRNGKNNE